jgi:hypothetical protein
MEKCNKIITQKYQSDTDNIISRIKNKNFNNINNNFINTKKCFTPKKKNDRVSKIKNDTSKKIQSKKNRETTILNTVTTMANTSKRRETDKMLNSKEFDKNIVKKLNMNIIHNEPLFYQEKPYME